MENAVLDVLFENVIDLNSRVTASCHSLFCNLKWLNWILLVLSSDAVAYFMPWWLYSHHSSKSPFFMCELHWLV